MIAWEGARLSHIAHGVIAPRNRLPFAERPLALFAGIGSAAVSNSTISRIDGRRAPSQGACSTALSTTTRKAASFARR